MNSWQGSRWRVVRPPVLLIGARGRIFLNHHEGTTYRSALACSWGQGCLARCGPELVCPISPQKRCQTYGNLDGTESTLSRRR